MTNATKRSLLRWIHIIFSIPILGHIYNPVSAVQPYAAAVRFLFVPVIVLSGFWMHSGVFFAIIGVAVWLGAYHLSGYEAAVLSQVALFIARQTSLVIRARHSKRSGLSMQCSPPLRGQRWLTFIVRRWNTLYEEKTHKRQSERNEVPKIQFS